MMAHLRANLLLLVFTVTLCSVLYPLSLWVVGQTVFPDQANGSLIYDSDGKAVASRLIAHEVKGDEYFQPRPSAVGYNGAASGASNWGANNYLLRDRVARAVAGLTTYRSGPKKGQPVAPDVVKWFREEKPSLAAVWAKAHPTLAQNWVKSDDATKAYVKDWFDKHPADLEAWKNENKTDPAPDELAVAFFEGFAKEHPGMWLTVAESTNDKGEPVKRVEFVTKASEDAADIAAVFFDTWRQEHPDVELTDVPADLVTASASGLDSHLTLKAAEFQLDRVAGKWAERTGQDATKLRGEIQALLRRHARAPMFGLAGVELVNVVEVNLALHNDYGPKVRKGR
jgi:potassium-transporting ATPase KdpC subunit